MIGVIDSVNSEAFEFCISVLSRNVPSRQVGVCLRGSGVSSICMDRCSTLLKVQLNLEVSCALK